MDSRAKELIKIGDSLFTMRQPLMSYWQEIGDNFYPERADFTIRRNYDDFWAGMMSSEPVLIRRELANLIQTMLRPAGVHWFEAHITDDKADKQRSTREWLEWMTRTQRRAMYDTRSQFTRATKEGDNDWVTFGQLVMEVDVHPTMPTLLYRCCHLKDVVWTENIAGVPDTIHRNWNPPARVLNQMFKGKVHATVVKAAQEEPEKLIRCRRIILPREDYDLSRTKYGNTPGSFVSIYVDMDNDMVLEEYPKGWNPYVIPRWTTVSGSQYGWSPCTGPGLADARTLQAVVRILLEAGEKAVDPPLVATQDVVRSDINVYAGGVTWIDDLYDERMGDALRPLSQDRSGLPIGFELADRFRNVLTEGFFLNKLTLPEALGEMTAYEVRKRLEEHIRAAVPLLAPAEEEYNTGICERTFDVLMQVRAFGPLENFPQELRGQQIRYDFRSPIKDIADEALGQKLIEATGMIKEVGEIDPSQTKQVNWDKATRGALQGINIPAEWLNEEDAPAQMREQMEQQKNMEAGVAAATAGGQAMESVGRGKQALLAPPVPAQ